MICATTAGGLIGFERDVRNRPAGLRTHALVSTGAALFTIAGVHGFDTSDVPVDATRIAAQVVTGLGFIGAGTILHDRASVRGLTTASTIWASGALGLAYAAGLYLFATVALSLSLAVLIGGRPLRHLSSRIGRSPVALEFEYETGHGTMGPILRFLDEAGMKPTVLTIDDDEGAEPRGLRLLHVEVLADRSQLLRLDELLASIRARPEVHRATATTARVGESG